MVEDLLMMLRTSEEFNFQISTFHHAIEAWKIAGILASENIGVATFPDHWGFKLEAYDSSVDAGKILFDAGVKTAFKSDHPVIFAKYLIFEGTSYSVQPIVYLLTILYRTSCSRKTLGTHRIPGSGNHNLRASPTRPTL